MGKIEISVDVDTKAISQRITDRIAAGIEDGADAVADDMRRTASKKIRQKNAVWKHELLRGFDDATLQLDTTTVARLQNVADHAAYQEHGVSGVSRPRDTPYAYTDEKPPLAALLPWVEQHLTETGFRPQDMTDE